MAASVLQLKCECKNDPWGKKGSESLAGRLWSQIPGSGPLDDSESYSEMWMGTYPSVPSRLLSTDELLSDHLKRNPDLLGKASIQRYSTHLPFLPKVLSFAKALPLQMHPDKKLAEQLHAQDPIKFGDANHKPEIAVALTRFELFVGFKPTSDLAEIFALQPLQSILPKSDKIDAPFLRQACRALLMLSPEEVSDTISQIMKLPQSDFGKHAYIPGLLDRLSKQYSETDNGCLVAVLCMNFMTLEPGEAVCVPADSIHAWLSGDILECMARSDNVLNTGFCPRAERDNIDLFTQALTFQPQSTEAAILPAHPSLLGLNKRTVKYAPPFSEFNVLGVSLSGSQTETHAELQSPSILVVTQGSGKMKVHGENISYDLKEGSVFFAGQKAKLQFSTDKELSLYRAYATS
ncbi:uncharacterized protein N7469_003363 [Penicillium citrinum]|uniref:Mannose-6-phosphate isomerase n=2 Tax=Penicillium TaxID=5073 RepID=A0A9W9P315_PENCI|nr:uncharacterized protein N7469_003363 [Penicillium citrinum]KAJ5234195.1 hypothetical protein N7469_003363 [Penicillium citrinum]KAJ5589804.1 hypothetical protein N7450_003776 [Penicillium hetheringtonii]